MFVVDCDVAARASVDAVGWRDGDRRTIPDRLGDELARECLAGRSAPTAKRLMDYCAVAGATTNDRCRRAGTAGVLQSTTKHPQNANARCGWKLLRARPRKRPLLALGLSPSRCRP